MEKKHALMSKTIWVNLIMAIVAVVSMVKPGVKEILSEANVLMIFSVINIVLRAITKDQVYFK